MLRVRAEVTLATPTTPEPRLVLASASPRRHAILGELGFDFDIDPADVDETETPGLSPREIAVDLALRKARAVAARRPGAWVVGSDTIVALGDRLLGKPGDAEEARATLASLSGSRHEVITGVAVVDVDGGREVADCAVTEVWMRRIEPGEIDEYVASGECFGKAGAYAIQERGDRFVTRLEGPYDNVVGFPSAVFLRLVDQLRGDAAAPGAARRGA